MLISARQKQQRSVQSRSSSPECMALEPEEGFMHTGSLYTPWRIYTITKESAHQIQQCSAS